MRAETIMSRAGRKHKCKTAVGAKSIPAINYRAMAAEQPHRIWLPEPARLDQRADSVLGCLYLNKRISESQYLAGEVYARRVGSYRATIGSPRSLAGSGKGYDCKPDGCNIEPDTCECHRRRLAYEELFEVLTRAGRKPMLVVNRVAIHNQACLNGEISLLHTGLWALARHLS